MCLFHYYDHFFFGYAREDSTMHNTNASEWMYPTVLKRKKKELESKEEVEYYREKSKIISNSI